MKRIFDLVEKIHHNYGVYIGTDSLPRLATFLSGYECAINELLGEWTRFDSKFQIFIQYTLSDKNLSSKHWDGLICDIAGEDAFEQFYIYLEDFKRALDAGADFDQMLRELS